MRNRRGRISTAVRYQPGRNTHAANSVPTAVSHLPSSVPKTRRGSAKSIITTPMERWTGDTSRSTPVHLKRPGLNLRDLLGCKSNVDFAYQLFQEEGGFNPWSTYNSGKYRQFLTQ